MYVQRERERDLRRGLSGRRRGHSEEERGRSERERFIGLAKLRRESGFLCYGDVVVVEATNGASKGSSNGAVECGGRSHD